MSGLQPLDNEDYPGVAPGDDGLNDLQREHASPCCGASWWAPRDRARLTENWVCSNCHRPVDLSQSIPLGNGVYHAVYGIRESPARGTAARTAASQEALAMGRPHP